MAVVLTGFIFAFCYGCASHAQQPETTNLSLETWTSEHLRLIDDVDSANSGSEIIALYSRNNTDTIDIRVDFLDLERSGLAEFSIFLQTSINHIFPANIQNSHSSWDLKITLSLSGEWVVLSATGEDLTNFIQASIINDKLDYIAVSFSDEILRKPYIFTRIWTEITPHGSASPSDATKPIRLLKKPDSRRSKVILVFWDTLPASTPSQLLRGWDGAHSGPRGSRHGLKWLLEFSSSYRVPLILLDLKRPESLFGVDYLGQLPEIQRLENKGLITLPDPYFGDPRSPEVSIAASRMASRLFLLPDSQYVYTPILPATDSPYHVAFSYLEDPFHIAEFNNVTLVPLPDQSKDYQSTHNQNYDPYKLNPEFIKSILYIALTPDKSDLIVLGGSISDSNWSDAIFGEIVFQYIATHPWIEVLTGDHIINARSSRVARIPYGCVDLLCQIPSDIRFQLIQDSVVGNINHMPENKFREIAQMNYSLNTPIGDLDSGMLLSRDTFHIQQASFWAGNPEQINDCSRDIDFDDIKECILASEEILLIISPIDGSILNIFGLNKKQDASWFVFTDAYMNGQLDDWTSRQPENQMDVDPFPGLVQENKKTISMGMRQFDNHIQFNQNQTNNSITYSLNGSKLSIDVQNHQTRISNIFFAMKPASFLLTKLPEGADTLTFHQSPRPQVTIQSAACDFYQYSDTKDLLSHPEDPDFGYPPGHFLPFFSSALYLSYDKDLSINLDFSGPEPVVSCSR